MAVALQNELQEWQCRAKGWQCKGDSAHDPAASDRFCVRNVSRSVDPDVMHP